MANINAADVAKLRKMTGAGMMDCKRALQESDGNFEQAIEILRKKGQKIAIKRADREATEGVVLAKSTADRKITYMLSLNCETDFVAKNEDFIKAAYEMLDLAVEKDPSSLDELKQITMKNGHSIADEVINLTGVIGEKIDLSYFNKVSGESTGFYIHSDKKVASIVAMNKVVTENVIKDVAMQATAMNPVSLNENDVPQEVIDKEIEIGREQAINEGKPADMAEKIAKGKLNKFFKENTLLNQAFIKDNKTNVSQYLQSVEKELTVVDFKRFSLRD